MRLANWGNVRFHTIRLQSHTTGGVVEVPLSLDKDAGDGAIIHRIGASGIGEAEATTLGDCRLGVRPQGCDLALGITAQGLNSRERTKA